MFKSLIVLPPHYCLTLHRVFGGFTSEADAYENVKELKKDLQAAGKLFDGTRFEAAGYDAPWNLVNRHNEVWLYAL